MAMDSFGRAATFVGAARCYWLEVFGAARRELREWRRRAEEIPDERLRSQALLAQRTKNGNAEGLAAFAVLAPRPQRGAVVRALVAYQTALDYLDTITDPPRDLEELKLHRALQEAVDGERPLAGYREEIGDRSDRDYLLALVGVCRGSLAALPSYAAALPMLRRRARLGAESQEMNHSLLMGRQERQLEEWAHEVGAAAGLEPELRWWETFAAGASTPALGALVALAARPGTGLSELSAVEDAYFPWVNALNTLLDNLVDLEEDPAQLRHIERYGSTEGAAERLAAIAARARTAVAELPGSRRHELILAAMGGYYLAQPGVTQPGRREIAEAVFQELGPFAAPTRAVHRLRQGRIGIPVRAPQRPGSAAGRIATAATELKQSPSAQRTWQPPTAAAASGARPTKR